MTLVARHVRSSTDPGAAAVAPQDIARTVVVGEADVFLPRRTLAPVVRGRLGVQLGVIGSGGHLLVDEHPDTLAELATDESASI